MSGSASAFILRVDGLAKAFGDVKAVDGLSLEIRRGEIFGFLGPNGAGKTTTIKMMCGLLRPDRGSVMIDGTDPYAAKRRGLRSIGLSPQAIVIWETLTCYEQLEFIGRMYELNGPRAKRRSLELLETFGLMDKRNKLGRTLSGGMQRRLNIALALVHEPEILFLDEPQAGLDPQSRVLVRDYLRTLAAKTTIVLTTHDMEEADKLSDRVCIIDRGQRLVLDTVENIKAGLGQGDLVEIELAEDVRESLVPHIPGLQGANGNIVIQGRTLTLVSSGASDILAEILQVVKERGLRMEHLRVRPKTLEDVFIRLTGRGLRE
ncbi:MAG: ABC transporter ATP-binding protein [Candidatus Aminicenantes bacterium]|nr:ABC transporter ATP-binding protein [Candidatus Aminicenantes bacterium]